MRVAEHELKLGKYKSTLRSEVAERLEREYGWPIGHAEYPDFRAYALAAQKERIASLYHDKGLKPVIISTGKLEQIFGSKSRPSCGSTRMRSVLNRRLYLQSASKTIGRKDGLRLI
jgi:hypothetical protein